MNNLLRVSGSTLLLALFVALGKADELDRSQLYDCDTISGWSGSAELLFLRPFETDEDRDSDTDTNEYKPTARLTLGYTTHCGIGARLRWMDYDINTSDLDQSLQTWDSELYSNISIGCHWSGTISGGIRYARMREGTDYQFDLDQGYGPIAGVELMRHCSPSLSLYGIMRKSILVGSGPGGTSTESRAAATDEIQMGAEWRRCFCDGRSIFARLGIEGQHWNAHGADNVNTESKTFGLFGGVFSLGAEF